MKRFLTDAGKVLEAIAPTALVLIGAVIAAVGVGMIYLPAGVITGGVVTALCGIVLIRGGGDGNGKPI